MKSLKFRSRLASTALLFGAGLTFAGDRMDDAHPIEGLSIGPDTTVVTEPLNSLGFPDYRAAVDAQYGAGVSASENFWIPVIETMPVQWLGEAHSQQLIQQPGFESILTASPKLTPLIPNGTSPAELHRLGELQGRASSQPWHRDDLPEIAAWLDANGPALTKIAAAAKLPKAYAPMLGSEPSNGLYTVLLPHVQSSRDIARNLSARAQLAIAEGRADDAWQDLLTMQRIARHHGRSPMIIEQLVGIAIRSMAQDATTALLTDAGASTDVLKRRWVELAPVLQTESRLKSVVEMERLSCLEISLQLRANLLNAKDLEMFTSLGGSPAANAELGLPDFRKAQQALHSLLLQAGDVNEALTYCNSYFDDIEDALSQPTYSSRRDAVDEVATKYGVGANTNLAGTAAVAFLLGGPKGLDEIGHRTLIRELAPAFRQVNTAEGRILARGRLLFAAYVAELARREGADITSGEELRAAGHALAADLGSGTPQLTDPFVEAPFQVRSTNDGLRIYSIGDNGKDEGGKTFGDGPGTDDLRVTLQRPPAQKTGK